AGEGDLHAQARDRVEQALFDAALAPPGGPRGEAAARLGLGRNTLTRRLGPGRKRR
ncbi:MAG: helix-turn-helix domain-containing protein, partial [Luteimonas sp.]